MDWVNDGKIPSYEQLKKEINTRYFSACNSRPKIKMDRTNIIFRPISLFDLTPVWETHVWRTVADQEGPRKWKRKEGKKKRSPGQWIAGASRALQNAGPPGSDMWWCFVRGNGMYLHGQIHQSRGLFPQFTGIPVFDLAGLSRACQGLGSLRSQHASVCVVCVCVAAGLPGLAACSAAHQHTQLLHTARPLFRPAESGGCGAAWQERHNVRTRFPSFLHT